LPQSATVHNGVPKFVDASVQYGLGVYASKLGSWMELMVVTGWAVLEFGPPTTNSSADAEVVPKSITTMLTITNALEKQNILRFISPPERLMNLVLPKS
jgi:hypothetical protein